MSLDHAILGFLNYKPFSGYDLKKVFDGSVNHFWAADQSQIYRTLARLVTQGLAEVERVEQQTRPDRKVYHITPAGRDELRRWLSTPLPPDAFHNAELVQVFFAGQLPDENILSLLNHQASYLRSLLDVYAQICTSSNDEPEHPHLARDEFFWDLTLECGIHTTRATLEWVESVIQRIENHVHPPMPNAHCEKE